MTNQPQFIDDASGVIAPTAPPPPRQRPSEAQRRSQLFSANFDLYLLAVVGLLCSIGLLMVYSASIDASFLATEDASTTYFFERQLFPNLTVGLIVMYILARLDYRLWRRLSILGMLGIIASLVLVLVVGDDRLMARRALLSGSYQPGEAAKLVVVVYMAAWLASKRHKLRNITYGILPFSIMVGTVSTLIILQPDISTAASILATALTMFFLAGASWAQLFVVGVGGVSASWFIATQFEYARQRIDDHLAAIENLTLANDHVQAAIVAFLDGGLFGVGLGEGRQKYVIPFPHTDSVFAVIGEELGLFGCAVVIALYVAFVFRGFTVAHNAPDAFGALLASGITIWLVYDALLNIAVMTALVPPTGVALPFISFGGSSLVSALAGVGLILSVSRVSARIPVEERERRWAEEDTPPPPKPVAPRPVQREQMVRQPSKASRKRRPRQIERIAAPATEPDVQHRSTADFDAALEVLEPPRSALTSNEDDSRQRDMSYMPDDAENDNSRSCTDDDDIEPPSSTLAEETPEDDDPDSDLGGGDRRGRISRISCR